MHHDQLVQACRQATEIISPRAVGSAFVASLTTKRLDLRVVLPSFAVCRKLPLHEFQHTTIFTGGDRGVCAICGLPEKEIIVGSEIQSPGPAYYLENSLAVLENFPQMDKPEPTSKDIESLKLIISRLGDSGGAKLGELPKLLQGVFPSNKYQRQDLLGFLAIAGAFKLEVESFFEGWVPFDLRESVMPSHFYAKDSLHPLRHYKPGTALNWDALNFWFGDMIKNA